VSNINIKISLILMLLGVDSIDFGLKREMNEFTKEKSIVKTSTNEINAE
jgi:hypothetical protein